MCVRARARKNDAFAGAAVRHPDDAREAGTYAELIKLQDVMGRDARDEEKSDQL